MASEATVLPNSEICSQIADAIHKIDPSYGVNLYPSRIKVGRDGSVAEILIYIEAMEYDDEPFANGRKHISIKQNSGKLRKFAADKYGVFKWDDIAKLITKEADTKMAKGVEKTKNTPPSPAAQQALEDFELLKRRFDKISLGRIASAGASGISLFLPNITLHQASVVVRELQNTTFKF